MIILFCVGFILGALLFRPHRATVEGSRTVAILEHRLRLEVENHRDLIQAQLDEAREELREFMENERTFLLIGDGALAGGTQIKVHTYYDLNSHRCK